MLNKRHIVDRNERYVYSRGLIEDRSCGENKEIMMQARNFGEINSTCGSITTFHCPVTEATNRRHGISQEMQGEGERFVSVGQTTTYYGQTGNACSYVDPESENSHRVDDMVNKLVISAVRGNIGANVDREIRNVKRTLIASFVYSLKQCFAVSHVYVGMKLLSLFFPYVFILKQKEMLRIIGKRRDVMNINNCVDSNNQLSEFHKTNCITNKACFGSSDIVCDSKTFGFPNCYSSPGPPMSIPFGYTSHDQISEYECTTFSFSSFFACNRKVDLYIPLMGFMTYVLAFGLARGAAGDFCPELLGKTATFGFMILFFEVFILKISCYFSFANHISIFDLVSCSGYKYVNLVAIILLGISVHIIPSLNNQESIADEAHLTDHINVVPIGSFKNSRHTKGQGIAGDPDEVGGIQQINSDETILTVQPINLSTDHVNVGKLQLHHGKNYSIMDIDSSKKWSNKSGGVNIYYVLGFMYLTVCVSIEMYRNLIYLNANPIYRKDYNKLAYCNMYNIDDSIGSKCNYSSNCVFHYIIYFIVFLQIPFCWLLAPRFDHL